MTQAQLFWFLKRLKLFLIRAISLLCVSLLYRGCIIVRVVFILNEFLLLGRVWETLVWKLTIVLFLHRHWCCVLLNVLALVLVIVERILHMQHLLKPSFCESKFHHKNDGQHLMMLDKAHLNTFYWKIRRPCLRDSHCNWK